MSKDRYNKSLISLQFVTNSEVILLFLLDYVNLWLSLQRSSFLYEFVWVLTIFLTKIKRFYENNPRSHSNAVSLYSLSKKTNITIKSQSLSKTKK